MTDKEYQQREVHAETVRLMERDLSGHLLNERQRESITKILLSLCVAVFTLSRIEGVSITMDEVSVVLIVISIAGMVISLKHSERSAFHLRRYKSTRSRYHNELDLAAFEAFNEFETKLNWPLSKPFSYIRVYILWPAIFLFILILDIFIMIS